MYDITVSGFGHRETYKRLEMGWHEEFYVRAIELFVRDLKSLDIEIPPLTWTDFLCKLDCTYQESK